VIIIKYDQTFTKIMESSKMMHKRKLSHFMLKSNNSTKEERCFNDPYLSELMLQEADLSRLINARTTVLQEEGKKKEEVNNNNIDSSTNSSIICGDDQINSSMKKKRKGRQQSLVENPSEKPATFDVLPQQTTPDDDSESEVTFSPLVGSFIQLPFSGPNDNWIWHVSFVLCCFNTANTIENISVSSASDAQPAAAATSSTQFNATQLFKIMFDDGTFLIRPLDNLVKGLLWTELQQQSNSEELVDIFTQRLKTFNPDVFDELAEHFYNWSLGRKISIAEERR
jgi:hypothetical protein